MASKSAVVQGMWFGAEFLSNAYKAVVKFGGTAEDMHDAMKTEGNLAEELAELIVARARSAKKFALKSLKLIAERISVSTDVFTKYSFFKNGPVKLWFGANFKGWILNAIPENIPAFEGNLAKFELTKSMNDSEILAELGSPQPFAIAEFAATLKSLIEKQPKGEAGTLVTNGYANIFHVEVEGGRVVAVHVYWYLHCRGWNLDAYGLGDNGWSGGHCVFSRS